MCDDYSTYLVLVLFLFFCLSSFSSPVLVVLLSFLLGSYPPLPVHMLHMELVPFPFPSSWIQWSTQEWPHGPSLTIKKLLATFANLGKDTLSEITDSKTRTSVELLGSFLPHVGPTEESHQELETLSWLNPSSPCTWTTKPLGISTI